MYDAVEFFASTWEKGTRHEERLTGRDELEAAGFLRDPVIGKVQYAWVTSEGSTRE